eukprot:gene5239-130_t
MNHYNLGAKIGEGSFAVVWKAALKDDPGNQVAIKKMRKKFDKWEEALEVSAVRSESRSVQAASNLTAPSCPAVAACGRLPAAPARFPGSRRLRAFLCISAEGAGHLALSSDPSGEPACLAAGLLRELRSLKKLSHPHIVKLREVIRETADLYFVFEWCDQSLYSLMKGKGSLDEARVRSLMYQGAAALDIVVCCLALPHDVYGAPRERPAQNGFFHRDLKPENLLMPDILPAWLFRCGPLVADFGLAKEIRSRPPHTNYISTRWYRAPELLLHSTNYNSPIDLWASGTIMAEMIAGRPLFPGTSEQDTIFKIVSLLGTPTPKTWPDYSKLAKDSKMNIPQIAASPLLTALPSASAESLEVISHLLRFDPAKRPSAETISSASYFSPVAALRMASQSVSPDSGGPHVSESAEFRQLAASPVPRGASPIPRNPSDKPSTQNPPATVSSPLLLYPALMDQDFDGRTQPRSRLKSTPGFTADDVDKLLSTLTGGP